MGAEEPGAVKKEERLGRGRRLARSLVPIILAVGLALLGYFSLGVVMGTDTPLVVVPSGSMRPTISVGDILLIQGVKPEEIVADPVKGDVIVFWQPGGSVRIVHRAVGKTEYGVITKGDANAYPDFFSPVPYSLIVGKWTGVKIPAWTGLGYLALILRGELYAPLGQIIWAAIILINILLIAREIFFSPRSRASP
ncbi:MAG: signal peptidase I [Nitrososphaerota archaeon]